MRSGASAASTTSTRAPAVAERRRPLRPSASVGAFAGHDDDATTVGATEQPKTGDGDGCSGPVDENTVIDVGVGLVVDGTHLGTVTTGITGPLRPPRWPGRRGRCGERETCHQRTPRRAASAAARPSSEKAGRPVVTPDDLDVAEVGGPDADPERLQDRFFGRETGSQAGGGILTGLGVGTLAVGEETARQPGTTARTIRKRTTSTASTPTPRTRPPSTSPAGGVTRP